MLISHPIHAKYYKIFQSKQPPISRWLCCDRFHSPNRSVVSNPPINITLISSLDSTTGPSIIGSSLIYLTFRNVLPNDHLQQKLYVAEKLSGEYSVHRICDKLDIARGTDYNHILRSKRDNT